MKAVQMLVKGKEVDLEELGGRADKAQIQKVIELSSPSRHLHVFVSNGIFIFSIIRYRDWSCQYLLCRTLSLVELQDEMHYDDSTIIHCVLHMCVIIIDCHIYLKPINYFF